MDEKYSVNLEKQQILKSIIKKLHSGMPVDQVKNEFSKLIKNTSPEEIADMENPLINEGFPVEEVQRLCDVHAQVFEQSLQKVGKSNKIPGHPIYSFIEENKQAKKILKALNILMKRHFQDIFMIDIQYHKLKCYY